MGKMHYLFVHSFVQSFIAPVGVHYPKYIRNNNKININCNTIETQKVLCKYHCKISNIWTVLRKYLTIMKIDYMCLLFKKFYLHHFHIKLLPFMPLFQLFVKLVVVCFPYRLSICAKNNILTKYRNWNN